MTKTGTEKLVRKGNLQAVPLPQLRDRRWRDFRCIAGHCRRFVGRVCDGFERRLPTAVPAQVPDYRD